LIPDQPEAKIRARLGAVGIGAEIAANPVKSLSGGQKARLLLALMTVHEPQLIILDEPTNHLDIESREALAQALAAYEGAVILVAHDAELVSACADRLWLVKDGAVRPFDGDMNDYRDLLLSERGGVRRERVKEAKEKPPKASKEDKAKARAEKLALQKEVNAAEARVAKIEDMKTRIDAMLADPKLYMDAPAGKFEDLQKKRAEIIAGLEKAEAIWMKAQERLDALK
ncbi:MAG: ATP-binding cassette domain-containing protein, partial [Pseudomonadota bacterium]